MYMRRTVGLLIAAGLMFGGDGIAQQNKLEYRVQENRQQVVGEIDESEVKALKENVETLERLLSTLDDYERQNIKPGLEVVNRCRSYLGELDIAVNEKDLMHAISAYNSLTDTVNEADVAIPADIITKAKVHYETLARVKSDITEYFTFLNEIGERFTEFKKNVDKMDAEDASDVFLDIKAEYKKIEEGYTEAKAWVHDDKMPELPAINIIGGEGMN